MQAHRLTVAVMAATLGLASYEVLRGARSDLVASGGMPGDPLARPVDHCLGPDAASPLITEDSIGILPARASIGELRRLCPSATLTRRAGMETVSPALRFRL